MSQKPLSLHRNEYYFEHSPRVQQLLQGPIAPEFVSTYATRENLDSFVRELASSLGVPTELVTLYHGAEDALFKILSWASSRQLTVHTTSLGWAEYMRMMQGLELEVKQTPLTEDETGYQHPREAFRTALAHEPSRALVLLASPNNPTGHDLPTEEILQLARLFPQHTFLIDRVYTEFSSTTFAPLAQAENIIAVGSFSKFFGLPGLRVGYAVGRVPTVQSMALGPSPWALEICRAALSDCAYYKTHWDEMRSTSSALQKLKTNAGHFLATTAPFVLFRCHSRLTDTDIEQAQREVQLRGKTLLNQGKKEIRWSLGSPEAYQRIVQCIKKLESRLSY